MPTTFKYSKTSSYDNSIGFKLSKVVFSGDIGTRVDTPTLPQTNGQITLSKFAAASQDAPTIDLYFQGKIRVREGSWDIDDHSYITWNISSITPSTFDTGASNYGLNKAISIKYSVSYSFDEGYEYSSYYIRFTINWGKNSSNNYVYIQSQNANGTVTLAKPSTFVGNVFPTITVSGKLYSKQSSGPTPGEEWTAVAVGNHATYDEDTGRYISLFNGTEVYVYGVSGDSRHCSWEVWDNWYGQYEWITVSAWIDKNWINPQNNPN